MFNQSSDEFLWRGTNTCEQRTQIYCKELLLDLFVSGLFSDTVSSSEYVVRLVTQQLEELCFSIEKNIVSDETCHIIAPIFNYL
jgi:hypothetical protein